MNPSIFFDNLEESGNVRHFLDNLYTKFQPIEQARWNQSHIDTMFYAGCQEFVNNMFNFSSKHAFNNYYFNLVQQPINMITGYQRQHRKSLQSVPFYGGDPETTDQYTRVLINECNVQGIHEKFSRSCELSASAGMNLMQPYLDFMGRDPAQGDLQVKIWEYNSFLIDPYFREADLSDCRFIWCQEYIDKNEAIDRFPDHEELIKGMSGAGNGYGNFYFLPENQNMRQEDYLVLSYVWYKSRVKKKKLYSRKRKQFFEFGGDDEDLSGILFNIPDLQEIEVEVPGWKVAIVLNDQKLAIHENPLGFTECPFVVNYWNYDPQISDPNLRDRSLTRCMRDPQFLYNYKVITNNDMARATINSGYIRKNNAVANEENLKRADDGYDIIINEGYEIADCQKIEPTAVPQSDLELAQQMADLIYNVSGIQIENWAGQDDKQISALTAMLKQAANLMVFQKYFDQWDYALRRLGDLLLKIVLYNWNAEKVGLILGEEPTAFFFSKIFSNYKMEVEEADLTATQRSFQAQQMFEINERFGREVLPPSLIIEKLNIQGKAEIIEYLKAQEQQAQQMQSEQQQMQYAFEEAKLKELYSKAVSNIAMARERHGRSQSNLGLFEERLSEIQKNQSLSIKAKMEALEQLVNTVEKLGEVETRMKLGEIEKMDNKEDQEMEQGRMDAKRNAEANKFVQEILNNAALQQNQQVV